jgi:hypothetical protein
LRTCGEHERFGLRRLFRQDAARRIHSRENASSRSMTSPQPAPKARRCSPNKQNLGRPCGTDLRSDATRHSAAAPCRLLAVVPAGTYENPERIQRTIRSLEKDCFWQEAERQTHCRENALYQCSEGYITWIPSAGSSILRPNRRGTQDDNWQKFPGSGLTSR